MIGSVGLISNSSVCRNRVNIADPIRDIADIATRALPSREYDGMSLPITGPEALSYAEMAEKIGAAIGKELTFVPISEEQVRRDMIGSNDSDEIVAAHLSIYRAIREERLAAVTNTVERVLGRNAIPFDRWVQENAAAFIDSARTQEPMASNAGQ